MDPFEILKNDHRQVATLFGQFAQAESAAEKRSLIERIREQLELHADLVETALFPFLAEDEEFEEIIEESLDDDQEIKELLFEISETMDENELDGKMGELLSCVEQHNQREEDELFPQIEEALDSTRLMQLASKLEQTKKSLPSAA